VLAFDNCSDPEAPVLPHARLGRESRSRLSCATSRTATTEEETMPPGWFGSKRLGWGVRPVSWQGWALTGLYVVLALVLARMLAARHVALFLIALVALTAAYLVVAGLTSRARR
jgi:hypothetical protein